DPSGRGCVQAVRPAIRTLGLWGPHRAGDVADALLDVPPEALPAHLKQPVASDERLRSWQLRIFGLLWGAYASYYLCRLNFAVAQPLILRDFPAWTNAQIGTIP